MECKLKIGSWTYDQSEMDIDAPETFGMSALDFTLFQEKNYKVLDSSVDREEKEYPCCPGEIYPSLDFNIKFKRTAKMNQEGKMEYGAEV